MTISHELIVTENEIKCTEKVYRCGIFKGHLTSFEDCIQFTPEGYGTGLWIDLNSKEFLDFARMIYRMSLDINLDYLEKEDE